MTKGIWIFSLILACAACSKANRAIDATNSMPQKMDDTSKKIDDTNGKIGEMNDVVRQQPVQISFDEMLKPEYGQDLDPIPFDIMPFAEKFGEYASAEDVVQIVYLWMKKLNELPLTVENPTPEQIAAFDHHKLQTFSALQAVCGMLPEDKVDEVIANEINVNGRFQTAGMQLLALRARFIHNVLLEASLFSEPLDNVGKLEKAVEYIDSVDKIARLPFASELKVQISGFADPAKEIDETFDPALALQLWTKTKTKAHNKLVITPKEWTGDTKVDQKLFDERQARANAALKSVDEHIQFWTTKPPLP